MSNVRTSTFRSDADLLDGAAAQLAGTEHADLGELLAELARVLRGVGNPPLSETEMFRWSGLVGRGVRIARERVQ